MSAINDNIVVTETLDGIQGELRDIHDRLQELAQAQQELGHLMTPKV